jgi:uncharacterized membrane protein
VSGPRRRWCGEVSDRCATTVSLSVATLNGSSVPKSSEGGATELSAEPSVAEDVVAAEGEYVDGQPSDDLNERRVVMTGSFSGPLPPPNVLAQYEQAHPGLAGEIVEQWKTETAHRHATVDHLRQIDREAMEKFYEGERRGQYIALVVFLGSAGVAALSIALKVAPVGIAAILMAGGSAIWSMRRKSDTRASPADLADGNQIEQVDP